MEAFLKKSVYNNEDKLLLLRHLEKKYRLRFDPAFANLPISWVTVREKRVIDKHFDSQRKSIFLLKGRIAVCEKAMRESEEGVKRYEEVLSVEPEKGIGALFSAENYQKVLLMCENSVLLEVEHG